MKNFFVSFALFAALIFVVSCGGGSKNNDSSDTTDSGETVTLPQSQTQIKLYLPG